MDGFTEDTDIIVLAATNRLDTLDSALLRPGRFDRRVSITQPDEEARLAILEVHVKNKPMAEGVDLAGLARKTADFSGAMLAGLLNEAAIFAARRGAEEITAADVDAGWFKTAVGAGRRRSMAPRERTIIAAHETGHAICGRVHGNVRKIERVSLYRHGEALGVTVHSSTDNLLPSESDLRAMLVALMGGRAAEALLFEEITGGASNDFEKANEIATQMVQVWGMGLDPKDTETGVTGRGSLGWLVRHQQIALSAEIQTAMTRAVKRILDQAYEQAVSTLVAERDTLARVAAYLYEKEEIDGEEFAAVCDGRLDPSPESLANWRDPASKPRPWTAVAEGLAHLAHRGASVLPVPVPVPILAPVPVQVTRAETLAPVAAPAPIVNRRRSGRTPLAKRWLSGGLHRVAGGIRTVARSLEEAEDKVGPKAKRAREEEAI
jgi:cell division protease FtsH